MRTTLDLPDGLIEEAMKTTRIRKKTDLIKKALLDMIQKENSKNLIEYFGKVDLDIDLDALRNR